LIHYEKEVDINNKFKKIFYNKIQINNLFTPQQTLKRRRTKLYHTLAFPNLLDGTENWTIQARDTRGTTRAEMKYMIKTAGYTETGYKTNGKTAKEINTTPGLDKMQEYRRNCLQDINRMPRI
jgi:hypothetical protein